MAQVDPLASPEPQNRHLLGVVGVEGDLLLECHALLLREREQAGFLAVRRDGVDLVLVDHQPYALAHDQLVLCLKGVDRHGGSVPHGPVVASE